MSQEISALRNATPVATDLLLLYIYINDPVPDWHETPGAYAAGSVILDQEIVREDSRLPVPPYGLPY